MEKRGWGRIVPSVVVLVLLGSAARAEDEAEKDFHSAIERGNATSVLAQLMSPSGGRLSRRQGFLLSACEHAARRAAWLRFGNHEDVVLLGDQFVALTEEAAQRLGGADELLALAQAATFRARVGLGEEDGESAPHLDKAITAARASYAAWPGKGEALLCAVLAAVEMMRTPKENRREVLAEAEKDVARLEEAHQGTLAAAHARAALEIAIAETDLSDSKARDRVAGALALLEPWLRQGVEVATTYNDAVSLVLANRKQLPLAVEYHAVAKHMKGLHLRVPVSTRWIADFTLYQFDRDHRFVRSFTVETFKWSTTYTYGKVRGIGGDNPKGLCTYDTEDVLGYFSSITRHRKATKGRMNRQISSCYYFRVEGIGLRGVPLTVSRWYFKAKKKSLTYSVLVIAGADEPGGNPAADFVVDSFSVESLAR